MIGDDQNLNFQNSDDDQKIDLKQVISHARLEIEKKEKLLNTKIETNNVYIDEVKILLFFLIDLYYC